MNESEDSSSNVPRRAFSFVEHPSLANQDSASENEPLLNNSPPGTSYGSLPRTMSASGGYPYTKENRPKRKPFHLSRQRRMSSQHDSQLYARFRYYEKLRAPVNPSEHALIIPDHVVPLDLFLPYIPGRVVDTDGKQASYITIIAIWNTMMGTSLLTMPWAFGQAGFAGGFIIMIGMAGLCLYTAYRMLTLQKVMGLEGELHEVGYLCRFLWSGSLGKAVEGVAVTFSVITLLGAQVVYWVLMSNFLYNSGEAIYQAVASDQNSSLTYSTNGAICPMNDTQSSLELADDSEDTFHRWWKQDLTVPLYLLVPFALLLNIRNPKIFTYFNSLGAISVFAMYFFVVWKAAQWGFNFTLSDEDSPLFIPLFKNTFMALTGTLSLAYFIHNCIITIMKGNRNPENNVRDLSIAYLLVSLTYIPIGVIFYMTFPLAKYCIADNFLDNFPPHIAILAVARGFLLFQMLTVYPLLTCFIRTQLFCYFWGPDYRPSFIQITLLNIFLLTICVLFAIFYPNIGFIIRWVGALAGLVYIFVLPCASYLQALNQRHEFSWKIAVPLFAIIFIGFANFALQFFL